MTNFLRISAIAIAAMLCACTSREDRAVRDSPDFQSGYAAGCGAASTQSANYREGPRRDEDLYKSSEAYRRGWGSGYTNCAPAATPRSQGTIIPDTSPGH